MENPTSANVMITGGVNLSLKSYPRSFQEPNSEYSPREYRGGYFLLSRTDEQGHRIEYGVNRLVKCRELPKLLTNAISEKCRKLVKIGLADSSSNPILLFYDDVYANIDSYNKAFAEIQGYEWVHSIFLVSSHLHDAHRRVTTFLYSKTRTALSVVFYGEVEIWIRTCCTMVIT